MREHPCAKNRRKSELIIFHTHVLYVHSPDGKTHNMWCSSRATHLFHRRSQYLGCAPHVWRAPRMASSEVLVVSAYPQECVKSSLYIKNKLDLT